MDTLSINVLPSVNGGPPVVDVVINGRRLIAMVRDAELPFAQEEGHPEIAGGYEGLPASMVLYPSRRWMDEEGSHCGRSIVLGCGSCGFPECWPLVARIAYKARAVVWSDFAQPFRDTERRTVRWRYDGFGSFVFDRRQYRSALRWPADGD